MREAVDTSVLLDASTKLIVQGITGHQGQFHTRAMLDYGTKVVGGVTPGKGGTSVEGVPVYDSCAEALRATKANASILFVPAPYAKDAAIEAVEAGIMPSHIFREGDVGVISRSGTLTYEIVNAITQAGFGQSTCLGIGGDPVIGTSMPEALELLSKDRQTRRIVVVGEIGGTTEEETAKRARRIRKPVFAYIAGRTAPPGKRMGHAGAIISGGMGTAESKVKAFADAGIPVADYPAGIAALLGTR